MGKTAVNARGGKRGANEALPPASMLRRVIWVLVAGVWLLFAASLVSFNSADAPSHLVAVHNDPPANWCGKAGAVVAYWSHHVMGLGAWVILLGVAGGLAVTVTGRVIAHPVLRVLGLALAAIAVAGFHGLFAPNVGQFAGAQPGLLGQFVVAEMTPRFSGVGTFVMLLAAFSVGAVVAADRLVLALPRLTMALGAKIAAINWPRPRMPKMPSFRGLKARPEQTLATPAQAKAAAARRGARSGGPAQPAIDPDAGGVGAVESFDPKEHELKDDRHAPQAAPPEPVESTRERLTSEQLREKIAKLPVRMAGAAPKVARDEDIIRPENFEGYQFPTLDLLGDPESNYSAKMEAFVRDQAQQLETALHTYGIDGEVVGIESGPVVTLYSVQLAPGTKVAKVSAISSDIARTLGAQNIRIVANMAGKTTVGIEVPNLQKEKVRLKELMSGGHAEGMMLPMFLGKDASGEPLVADLTRMPHMLIAGTTGSGKSVCMNTIIMSWLYTKRPDELKLVLVDPKMVEMSQFADIPHLMCPVVTESAKAAAILEWAVNKMEERYELLREARVRDIASYNSLTEEELYELFEPANDLERAKIPKKLPYMVFIIDELADLMMTNREAEHSIVRIAQKARAVGIHLILATQRPQANVVTGLIKSNMPCRASFKVASGMDSRIVLDQKGAELLLGQGDMLFLTPHRTELVRAQGTLVTDTETRKVASFLKKVAAPSFERSLIAIRPGASEDEEGVSPSERDPLFDQAVRIMIESKRGSVSLLQRRLAIGYSRASRLVDQMGLAGILGDHKGSVAREVLITMDEWEEMKRLESQAEASGTLFQSDSQEQHDPPFVETVSKRELDYVDDDEGVPAEYDDEYRR